MFATRGGLGYLGSESAVGLERVLDRGSDILWGGGCGVVGRTGGRSVGEDVAAKNVVRKDDDAVDEAFNAKTQVQRTEVFLAL